MDGYRSTRSGFRSQSHSHLSSSAPSPRPPSVSPATSSFSRPTSRQSSRPSPRADPPPPPPGSRPLRSADSDDPGRGRPKRSRSEKDDDDKTVKNPELVRSEKSVDNDDLINGLALQRLWDEKPDIDSLFTALMNLYQRLEAGDASGAGELRARIYLSALRVRSRSVGFVALTRSRLRALVRFYRHLSLRYNTLNHNVPRIERHYLRLCRSHQRARSLNEVYERLSRIVSRLPGPAKVESTSRELVERRLRTLARIERAKQQIELQKSQILEITQQIAGLTSK